MKNKNVSPAMADKSGRASLAISVSSSVVLFALAIGHIMDTGGFGIGGALYAIGGLGQGSVAGFSEQS